MALLGTEPHVPCALCPLPKSSRTRGLFRKHLRRHGPPALSGPDRISSARSPPYSFRHTLCMAALSSSLLLASRPAGANSTRSQKDLSTGFLAPLPISRRHSSHSMLFGSRLSRRYLFPAMESRSGPVAEKIPAAARSSFFWISSSTFSALRVGVLLLTKQMRDSALHCRRTCSCSRACATAEPEYSVCSKTQELRK